MAAEKIIPSSRVTSPAAVIHQAGGPAPQFVTGTAGVTTPNPVSEPPAITTAITTSKDSNTRTAQSVPVIIPAATTKNGQIVPAEIPIVATGNRFYLRASNGDLSVTPFRGGAAGTQNNFGVGQGREVESGFENLIVYNFNLFPVVGLLWIGFDNFINNQLIIDLQNQPNIAYPTYPLPNAASSLAITDRSGSAIQDVNGNTWLALYRVSILIFNLDGGNTYFLYKKSGSSGSPAVAAIPPAPLPIRLDFAGDFAINTGAPLNMIVSETYACISPNQ